MSNNKSLRIVLDACVLTSAGTKYGVSLSCASVLLNIQTNSSVVVIVSLQLADEWDRHMSRIGSTFVSAMKSKDRYKMINVEHCRDFREEVKKLELEGDREAVLKDAHLVEAAHWHGKRIISRDSTVRSILLLVDWEPLSKLYWAALDGSGSDTLVHDWIKLDVPDDISFLLKPSL